MAPSLASTALAGIALLGGLPGSQAKYLVDTRENTVSAARDLAFDLMSLYKGNETGQIPGILPGPPPVGDYYWWQGAGFASVFIDYWRWTGDATYNDVIAKGLLHQVGQDNNFQPANWTASMGNDDQCLWGLSALQAAESKFPETGQTKWLSLAENVFANLAERIQGDTTCGGGLRWQIFVTNQGYNYKNTFSNACFFTLGARLAKFTGNDTYSKAAESTWDWMSATGLINNSTWEVYDGAHTESECKDITRAQFSYTASILIEGAAYMYNTTSTSSVWKDRVTNLADATLKTFFPNGVATEVACETVKKCTVDMLAFKSYAHRSLAGATLAAPFTSDSIRPVLRKSAEAAIAQCTGGASGRQCGFYWADGKFVEPGTSGAGEQMDVLAAVSATLVDGSAASGSNGGGAGGSGGSGGQQQGTKPSSAGRASAATSTLLLGLAVWAWMAL